MEIILQGTTEQIAADIAKLHAMFNTDPAQLPLAPIAASSAQEGAKRGRPKKAANETTAVQQTQQIESAPQAETVPQAEPVLKNQAGEIISGNQEVPNAAPITYTDVRLAGGKILEVKGPEALLELVSKFKNPKTNEPCRRGSEIAERDYPAFMAQAKELIG